MLTHVIRVAAVAAGAALGTLGVPGAGLRDTAARAAQVRVAAWVASHTPTIPGAQQWARRYNGHGKASTSPGRWPSTQVGGWVFVTGSSAGATSGEDYLTIAYNAYTGARPWAFRPSREPSR